MPFSYYRTPLTLLGIVIVVCIATVIAPPAGRFSWLLEVGPGLAGIAVLVAIHRRFPMSHIGRIFGVRWFATPLSVWYGLA